MSAESGSAPVVGVEVVPFAALRAVATPQRVIAAVRAGFIGEAQRRVRQAPTAHLAFHSTDGGLAGDCHVKWGHDEASDLFVVKVATGFYDNPRRGLPASNGVMLLISARTGAPVALLEDRGWLTDMRTAAAGALAVEAAGTTRVGTLGIVGTGTQAGLQARWIAAHRPVGRVLVWGRTASAAERLAAGLRRDGIAAAVAAEVADLAAASDVIVTTTPSSKPLLMNSDVRDGTVIVAVGADARGKRELDPGLLRRAARIICDDPAQCLDHGELQDGGIDAGRLERLGALLADPPSRRPHGVQGLTLVDLTGIAAQDIAVAQMCWTSVKKSGA